MRARYGEKLTKESYLIREHFNKRDQFRSLRPKEITVGTLKWIVPQLEKRAGVRTTDVKESSGFRKFFTTQLINAKVNPEAREMLLGHKIGLASYYYRPTEEEMAQEYMKAVNNLTINEENRLKMKIEKLEVERSQFETLASKIEAIEKKIK
jgi:integrase/recombinase XerD